MGKKPRYQEIDGFRLPLSFVPEVFRSAEKYKPEKDEVVVATYPKCGTTWTMQIVLTILRKGVPCKTAEEYFASNPFLEMTGEEGMEQVLRPCCVKTHLPFDRINYNPEAKYIYIARHPEDCVVSFFHHARLFPVYFFSDGSFDDFFDVFVSGQTDFNDYFDNLYSWYNNRDKPNILFLTFEDLKKDTREAALTIARFLGDEYYQCLTADDEKILKDVLRFSSLDFMRETVNMFWRQVFLDRPPSEEYQELNAIAKKYAEVMKEATELGHSPVGEFIRKGDVGDGKIVLSDEQRQRMKGYISSKTVHDPTVMDLWPSK